MTSQITTLFNMQDNAEKIRDRIAAILKIELDNQKTMAENNPCTENKKDFDIKVYLENSRPWELTSDSADNNPFPLINIGLHETREDANPGSTVCNVKYTGTYYIDCCACGNFYENQDNYIPDDSLSTFKAWQLARMVRGILMSGHYAYLGMQKVVRRRRITKISTLAPGGLQDAAISITICRIFLDVDFHETSPEAQGVNFDEMTFTTTSHDGEVSLINISHDYTKNKE